MPRRKSATEGDESPSFEASLAELEAIVEAMEHEHLPLEELVSHYEKGSACLKRCEAVLNSARGRIELITLRNQTEIALEAGERSGDADKTPPLPELPDDSDADDENDIRLF